MVPQTPIYRAALAVLVVTLCAQLLITFFSSMLRTQNILPALRDKRVCLLIAHPDDEAMFFAPTVLALTRPEAGNRVTILSLSSGNAEGLGETRRRELVESALVLGLRRPEDVEVVDHPVDFPDSMTASWSSEKIASLLHERFASDGSSADPSIDVLITFDSQGVSSHPNHISLYHGARAFVSSLAGGDSPKNKGSHIIDLYALSSVNFLRKYTGMFDVFATLGSSAAFLSSEARAAERPSSLVYMHGLGREGWATARRAMTEAHVSQMRWFRYGWITLSRYMYVNDLNLVESS